jgi:AmmeMemoRadiSam system protein A
VVVLGPSHRHAFKGVALPDAEAMATPLGPIPLDTSAIAALRKVPDVVTLPAAFAKEHSIEVELPFLQRRLGRFSLVPLVVGEIAPDRLSEIMRTLWGGPETLIVISTDLTHFLTADQAESIDLTTARAIETAAPDGLGGREACGHRPLAAFLGIAAERGLRLTRLALSHSGNITGEMSRVVGYGAWAAYRPDVPSLPSIQRHVALRTAAQSIFTRATRGTTPTVKLSSYAPPLQTMGASFVTLTLEGRLRGCIGSLMAHKPLAEDIAANAIRAGFHDPRFKPITEDELRKAEIEIALLSRPAPMRFDSEADLVAQLRPGRDGLILRSGKRRGTFLPKVWEALETPEAFMNGLKVKAGLDRSAWPDDLTIERYTAESFKGRLGPSA